MNIWVNITQLQLRGSLTKNFVPPKIATAGKTLAKDSPGFCRHFHFSCHFNYFSFQIPKYYLSSFDIVLTLSYDLHGHTSRILATSSGKMSLKYVLKTVQVQQSNP